MLRRLPLGPWMALPLIAGCGKDDTGGTNLPPTGLEVKILPLLPVQRVDELRCTVEVPAVDAEDDPVTYAFSWTVDGEPFTDTENTAHYVGDVVPATATASLQQWTCAAVSADPYQQGAADSHTVTVLSGYEGWEDTEVDLGGADAIVTGEPGAGVGRFLAGAGDVDGDGLADVLVGAGGALAGGTGAAAVYVVHGSLLDDEAVPAILGSVISGESTDAVGHAARAGSPLGAGDTDGDGLGDVWVGVPALGVGGAVVAGFDGASLGAIHGIADASWRIEGGTGLGNAIAIGDVDGDGLDDVLAGAEVADVWLFFGDGLQASADTDDADAHVGLGSVHVSAIDAGGDVDGDGIADVVIGSEDDLAWVAGLASLTADMAGACALSGAAGSGFGTAAAIVADSDGDGTAEVAVGAPEAEGETGAGDGVVTFWRGALVGDCGSALTTEDASATMVGWQGGAAGSALAALDFDTDAIGDLVVGAPLAGGGLASLLLGAELRDGEVQLDSNVSYHLWAGAPDWAAATGLSGAGDVDGDGRSDLLVGAPGYGEGGAVLVVRSPP